MSKQVKISFKEVDREERQSVLDALKQIGLAEISSCHDDDTNCHSHRFAVTGELGRIIVTTADDLLELDEAEFQPLVER